MFCILVLDCNLCFTGSSCYNVGCYNYMTLLYSYSIDHVSSFALFKNINIISTFKHIFDISIPVLCSLIFVIKKKKLSVCF